MTFDAACRAMLFDICERHGLHLDHEPEYGGRKYLEKQDYILMKQKEKIAVQDQTISEKEAELKSITVRIEDTEAFVEEVSEVAYEKAVEVVTEKVVEETHNADFDLVMHQGKKVVSDPALSPERKKFANQVFGNLLQTFSGMTQAISAKLRQIFREPERKNEAKEPIRRSIMELLARNKTEADTANAARRAEQDPARKKKQKNIER